MKVEPKKRKPMTNVRCSVYAAAVVLAALPTLGGLIATRSIVESAITVGLNPRVAFELDQAGSRLKELARFNSDGRQKYRTEFDQLQEVRKTYDILLESAPALNRAYLESFGIIFAFALGVAVTVAWWLNRKVILSHDSAILEMQKAQERTLYLENRESWRLFAQKLVHEVKNPLTTVQIMVGRLPKKYLSTHPSNLKASLKDEFLPILNETQAMVTEEVQKLNTWIEAFSRYASMPEPKLVRVDPIQLLNEFVEAYHDFWPNLKFSLNCPTSFDVVMVDAMLMKQVLFNLAKNTAEASPMRPVQLKIKTETKKDQVFYLVIEDDGPGIPKETRSRLFQPYSSTKGEGLGMGLGLAIAKKVILDHGGDISLLDTRCGTAFVLKIPTVSIAEKNGVSFK